MPTEGQQIQFNGSTSGYPSLVINGTTSTVTNFPNGPWPAANYLIVYTIGAFNYSTDNGYWTISSAGGGNPSLQVTDGASNQTVCGPYITPPYASQALAQAAAALVANGTYWIQSGSGSIGIKTLDNPYTDNANGSPSPTYYLIPYPPQNIIATDTTINTPCGNIQTGTTLSWTAIAAASSFKVYRSLAPGGPYTFLGSSATNNYTDSNLSAFTEYYYVVTCIINTFESPYSSEVNTGSGLYTTVSPDVTTDNIAWFGGGTNYPAGIYRCCFVRGGYQYDQRGFAQGRGFTVNGLAGIVNPAFNNQPAGFYIVDSFGNSTLAPGNTTLYPSQAACEAGNAGASIIYSHIGGPLGVRLGDFPLWDNVPGSPSPTFTISVMAPALMFTAS